MEKQASIQNRRIRAAVATAYKTVPFYRRFMQQKGLRPADFVSAADLEKFPLLSSRDLSKNPGQFQSSALANNNGLLMETSGSTGLATRIRHDTRALFLARAGGHRSRHVLSHFVGKTMGYREVKVTRRGGTGPLVLQFYKDHSWIPGGVMLKRAMAYPEESFEENIRVINEQKPDVISGFGSYIGAIYRWAWTHGVPVYAPKIISFGGDAMQEPDRLIIENEYGIPVISRYQACEALNLAFQCEKGRGFHICTDQVAVRIVDGAGNTLPPGQTGELVISNLINRATVLLNYRIGDMAVLSSLACSCGRTLPMLEELQGRTDDLIVLPNGEAVHESVILSRIYSVPGVLQVQVIQEHMRRFQIKLVCLANMEENTVAVAVTSCFLDIIGGPKDVEVDIKVLDFIPQEKNGKFRSVICRSFTRP